MLDEFVLVWFVASVVVFVSALLVVAVAMVTVVDVLL